jgi:hypothetical protein
MAIGHTMVFGPVPSEVECHDANQRPDYERDFMTEAARCSL